MSPFRHGVASGDPLPDRVILWTRVTPDGGDGDPVDAGWVVARDPALADVVASGSARAALDRDFTVHVDADGLEPATTYHYGFEALGRRSPVGRTRTAPAGPCERLRIAVTSCAKFTAGWFNGFGRVADRDDVDFVLHLGDYIYEYPEDDGKAPGPAIGRPVEPKHECRTLADYRKRYAHHRLDPDLQRLHAAHPMIATIDDHELADDAWREGAEKHDPAEDGDWHARKSAALRAWREWLPVRPPDPQDPERIHRAFPLGDLAHLVVLDERTRRDEQAKGERLRDPDRTMLGRDQLEWLLAELRGSDATWRLVGNSVMLGQVHTDLMPEELGEPLSELGVLTEQGHGPAPDQWDGYPAERERLLRALADGGLRNVLFLSGDVHTAWAVELKRAPGDPDERPLAVELVTASVTSENLDEETGGEPGDEVSERIEREVRQKNPHVRWVDLDRHGYYVLDLTPERAHADFYFVGGLRERTELEFLGAAWRLRSGTATLERASEPARGTLRERERARLEADL